MREKVDRRSTEPKSDIVEFISGFAFRFRIPLLSLAGAVLVLILVWVLWEERERQVTERSSLRVERLQQLYQEWNSESEGDYKDSIGKEILERAGTIIKDYPRRYAAQRTLYTRAQYWFSLAEWELAKKDWIIVYEKWPGSYLAPLSAFNSAVAEEEMENYDAAIKELNQLIDVWSDDVIIPRALFSLGRLEEQKNNMTEAELIYDRLIEEYDSSSWSLIARNRIIAFEVDELLSED